MITNTILLVGKKAESKIDQVIRRYKVACFKESDFKGRGNMPRCDLTLILEKTALNLSDIQDFNPYCIASEDTLFDVLDKHFEIMELDGASMKNKIAALLSLIYSPGKIFKKQDFYNKITPYLQKKMPAKPTLHSIFKFLQEGLLISQVRKGHYEFHGLTEKKISQMNLDANLFDDLGIVINQETEENFVLVKKEEKEKQLDLAKGDDLDRVVQSTNCDSDIKKSDILTKEDLERALNDHTEYVETLFQEQRKYISSLIKIKNCPQDKIDKFIKIIEIME